MFIELYRLMEMREIVQCQKKIFEIKGEILGYNLDDICYIINQSRFKENRYDFGKGDIYIYIYTLRIYINLIKLQDDIVYQDQSFF